LPSSRFPEPRSSAARRTARDRRAPRRARAGWRARSPGPRSPSGAGSARLYHFLFAGSGSATMSRMRGTTGRALEQGGDVVAIGTALGQRLGRIFRERGHRLYLVGGPVRDQLHGRPTHDLDFATDAVPEETRRAPQAAGPDAIYAVGEKFGTIGANFGDTNVEITTFRGETYQPGSRKLEVRYGLTLEDDLARRDFTINAMARDLDTGAVIDPFGGRRDLEARLIRAEGDPAERFAEDPLRLLRAIRFAAQLGFSIEGGTRDAIARCAPLLRQVSRGRILDEMNKLLLAPHAALGVRLLADLGLLDVFLPEAVDLRRTTQGKRSKDVFEHTLRVIE